MNKEIPYDYKRKWLLIVACQEDHNLIATHINVFVRLVWHCNPYTGECFPSEETLAKTLGIDKRTVQRAIRELKAAGWIRTAPKTHFKENNNYIFAWERAKTYVVSRNNDEDDTRVVFEDDTGVGSEDDTNVGLTLSTVKHNQMETQENHNNNTIDVITCCPSDGPNGPVAAFDACRKNPSAHFHTKCEADLKAFEALAISEGTSPRPKAPPPAAAIKPSTKASNGRGGPFDDLTYTDTRENDDECFGNPAPAYKASL